MGRKEETGETEEHFGMFLNEIPARYAAVAFTHVVEFGQIHLLGEKPRIQEYSYTLFRWAHRLYFSHRKSLAEKPARLEFTGREGGIRTHGGY